MRKTAKVIHTYNPIQSKYSSDFINQPITNMIENILEKNPWNHILFKYAILYLFLCICILR